MKQYKLVDNLLGWLAFLIAAVVYCSTIEPTASFGTVLSLSLQAISLKLGIHLGHHSLCLQPIFSHILQANQQR